MIEFIHGYKLTDYFFQTRFRFHERDTAWISENFTLDKSIEKKSRTFDNLCFSE